jgi:hypothetical protein
VLAGSGVPGTRPCDQTLALCFLARRFAGSADGLAGLPRSLFGWLFIGTPPLHLPKKPFALKLLFQCSEGLVDIVVANENFQGISPLRRADRNVGTAPGKG